MQKIHNEIRRVDAGILAAVRQQVPFCFPLCNSLVIGGLLQLIFDSDFS